MFVGEPWIQLENVLIIVDILLLLVTMVFRQVSPRRMVVWALLFVIAPIAGFILYIFFGHPLYRNQLKAPPHCGDGLDAIERELADYPEREEKLMFARALSQAGALAYSADNAVEYISEGPEYYQKLFADLRAARSSISIECYIIRRDGVSNEFMDILIDRARAGVQVRVMFDAWGFGGRQMDKVYTLRRAGGECTMFHSMFLLMFSPRKNDRDHRKIAVIDGRIGWIGGYNIGDEHIGKTKRFGHWRDSAVRFRGSQVDQLQTMFAEDWRFTTRKDISGRPELFPPAEPAGEMPMQIVCGSPVNRGSNPLHIQYLTLIDDSEETVYIETPYLAPPDTLFYNLCIRAMSGTDVRIIIPDRPDHPCVYWANRYYADRLMAHGVRVYIYHNGFIHSKLLVGDGYYCSVGSGNLDERSMNLNFECNAMLYSSELGGQLNDVFMHDLSFCEEYSREQYAARTHWEKCKTWLSMLFYDQL